MTESQPSYDIICLSHLKWEKTLFQRPQQIMKQFARDRRVIYVAHCSTKEFIKAFLKGRMGDYIGSHGKNLHFLTVPFLPFSRKSRFLQRMTDRMTAWAARRLAKKHKLEDIYLWLYYPTYVKHLDLFDFEFLVYDCMDLFRGFRASVGDVQDIENELLEKADVVFTGGRSLQKSKEGVNLHTYCFPSGVEYDHFFKATKPETKIPDDIKDIPHPILGYWGAIDERIDFELIDHICEKKPDWSIVFLGPVVGLEEIPVKQKNFHHLGGKDYEDLPRYLKAFDACLMPFVISELTRHISPTKTPEYLSGGKPVVSTPIPDVMAEYSDVVSITGDYDEFIEKTEKLLTHPLPELHNKIRKKAETKSWEFIAGEMKQIISRLSKD